MRENKSPHILNTSSNLLGFCLIVLTSLKITKYNEVTIIDELTGITAVVLIICSIFSFLSIRTKTEELSERYEGIADVIFLIALIMTFGITFFIAFSFLV